ncbi:Aminomethyltransferase folate-binding domain-containing protein [Aureobasidium namibiae CBS 147.97]|uniref:Iron-sulfur cluster assembly factor IBA57 homolog, mitochondrial n=1 Tax=Aureobasidium namibiae CBS 147.97 TaxID=1043004 RepID=A0A074X741_9PEZI
MAVATPRQPFVCLRRLPKTNRCTYSTTTATRTPPPPPPPTPPPSGAAKLSTRRLISLHGPDAPKFLQGILTNNVNATSYSPFFAAFLTAQGKVLHDVFVYPTLGSTFHTESNKSEDQGYLVEVDAEQVTTLLRHLKRHKLRSKFALRVLEEGELDIWAAWREGQKWTSHPSPTGSNIDAEGNITAVDTRATGMGQRILLPSTKSLEAHAAMQGLQESGLEAYTIRRYIRGVPEGQAEIPRDDVLPMNANFDIMGGIDFKKGCYVGQELTIRTHHTGVVRRRVLPVSLYPAISAPPEKIAYDTEAGVVSPAAGTEIKIQGKRGKPGRWISGVGNVGLAMCRLELMTDLQVTGEPSTFSAEDRFVVGGGEEEGLGVKAFVPDWMRSKIRAPKLQRRVE